MTRSQVTPGAATLIVHCETFESDEDRDLVEKIAVHCGASQIRYLNGNNFKEHSVQPDAWFLIVIGWTGSPGQVAFTERFRQSAAYAPILVVAAENSAKARDLAFSAGADNYVSPGASDCEIIAKASRLKAMADMAKIAEAPLVFGDVSIWLNAKVVMRDHQPIALSARESAILMYMAKKSPRPVSRAAIEQDALGIRFDPGTNVVAVHMHRIRQKIGDSKSNRLIQSIPGVGYRMCSATNADFYNHCGA